MNRLMKPGARERETLLNSGLLSVLGVESVAAMMEIAAIGSLPARQMLFREGEPADMLHCVLSGYVRVYKLDPDGREADVELYGPGDLIGASVVLDGGRYRATAQAAEPSLIARFDLKRVRDIASRRTDLAMALATSLSGQLARAFASLADDRLHTAPQRVAHYLLAHCTADGKPASFRLPYQKSLLAGKLGLAPEALSRAFSMLRNHGVSVRGRLVHIGDPEALRRI
ncbi:Crp/Fnr family transcriptional regulator [Shinella zoogloeoides]|uniref:Cyclic nucleotide-binding domain-containing protein n=1 Tax=Shinella zoogloeoides TaxID=352475 RepID=A0A6N8TIB1_SHIZO|nr:cyclic nucleotide-binding domain-containing protein [Shinella zoogloeoides]MXO00958.1 cyclic nucleotide-binding domain-containing protein [Shinella zoogloeoides]UEX80487.1 cyclic nucleotide-binding domain-containing protein [Shinella zoogloeoides]